MEDVKYIKTQRNGRKLIFQNFMYVKKNKSDISTYWACCQRYMLGCRATAITINLNEYAAPQVTFYLYYSEV